MTILGLEKKIHAESPNADAANWALYMHYKNIVESRDDNDAHKSWMYLKGVIAGLFIGSFLTEIDYTSLEREVNTAYNNRHKRGEKA